MGVDIVDMNRAEGALPPPPGFAVNLRVETSAGLRAIADLRPGDLVLNSSGGQVSVLDLRELLPSSDWISLPGGAGSSAMVVSAEHLLFCQHFLCTALFGARQVLVRAGAMTGTGVTISDGSLRSLYELQLETPALLRIGGYEFFCSPSAARASAASEGWQADEAGTYDGQGPHPGTALGSALSACPLLAPQETRQLCDSGVIFRGVRR